MSCTYCGKDFGVERSNNFHQIYCKQNPNKKTKSNQYSNPNYVTPSSVSEKRKQMMAKKNRVPWSDDRKRNHKLAMQNAVMQHPDAYTSSNRGRVKQVIYNGVKLHGSWELKFAQWCDRNDIEWEKNTKYFLYEWNGERRYFPDFYLPEYNSYVEVKGYETDRDVAKWNAFPEKLIVVKSSDIKLIDEDKFVAPW